MEKLITCEVCMEIYNEGIRCPRVLLCGHTFCSSCIKQFLETGSSCPNCKTSIDKENLQCIPINYALRQLADEYSHNFNDTSSSLVKEEGDSNLYPLDGSLPSRGFCSDHKIAKCFRCLPCKIWVCGNCVALDHKLCKTLLVTEAIDETKKEQNKSILKHVELVPEGAGDSSFLIDHYKDVVDQKTKQLEHFRRKTNEVKEEVIEAKIKMEKVMKMQESLAALKETLERQTQVTSYATSLESVEAVEKQLTDHFRAIQTMVENIKFHKSFILQQNVKQNQDVTHNKDFFFLDVVRKLMSAVTTGNKVLITSEANELPRYGQLDVREGDMRIRSSKPSEEPYPSTALYLTVDQCLTAMTGRKEWPGKIYLEIGANHFSLGEVVICLNKSAVEEASTIIRHTFLFGHEELERTSFTSQQHCLGPSQSFRIPPSIDRQKLLVEKESSRNWKEGEVALKLNNWNSGTDFQFHICLKENLLKQELVQIGIVEKGMDVIKDAYERTRTRRETVRIISSGWIVDY